MYSKLDVVEQVHDLPKVISEISRVLENGSLFIYDSFILMQIQIAKIVKVNYILFVAILLFTDWIKIIRCFFDKPF